MGRAVLRFAGRGDLNALVSLEAACFGDRRWNRETVEWILEHPKTATLIEDRGEVVGSIMVQFDPEACRVLSIAVLPDVRRRGIGRDLMAAAEGLARARGARRMQLEVGVGNAAAIQFYKRLGYKIEGVLPGYYRDGEDGYAMRKDLGANA